MSAKEWEKIKALFDAALTIPREQRSSWLNQVCADSPELRGTLEQLLTNYDESSDSDPRKIVVLPVFKPGDLVASRFYIIRLIAHGGMGEVYEARDSSLNGLRVALKTIRTGLASELEAYERFKREVWVAREIAHEGICRIYDLAEHWQIAEDGTERLIPCLTMKLLDGQNLATYLASKRPLSPEQALPIVRQIVQAVEFMHQSGIVHRDLKPSNIMLVQDEEDGAKLRAVITDFGLAKPLNRASMLWETRCDQQAGAPYFIAPEILGAGKGGLQADIYSLGLVIDEMVTRSAAFPHDSIEELFWKKLHGAPEPPVSRAEHLPKSWDHCIRWCLERDPQRRPRRVADVLACLDPSSNVKSVTPPPPHQVHRRAWFAATTAVVTAPAIALLIGDNLNRIPTSILVYPFVNATHAAEYDYLCSGIAAELTRRMTGIEDLRVFAVRDRGDRSGIEAVKAAYSLEGELERNQGGQIRLTVRLVENATGAVVWTHRMHRGTADSLSLEEETGHNVVAALTRQLDSSNVHGRILMPTRVLAAPVSRILGRKTAMLPVQATGSASAYDAYLQGRHLWQERTLPATRAAIELFTKATVADPKFALAYSALADSQITLLTWNGDATPKLLIAANEYAEKAVELDPTLPEVRASLAVVRQNLWDWPGAEAEYKKALELRPRFARAHHWYAGLLLQFGRFDDALAGGRRAIESDPLDYPSQSAYGLYLWNAGRLKEAAAHLEALLARKDLLYAHTVVGQVYAALAASTPEPQATEYFLNSVREAGLVRTRELEAAKGVDSAGDLKWSDLMFAQAHAARRDFASAQAYIRRLEGGLASGHLSASAVAWAHAASGNHARTLELLEIGLKRREREMLHVKVIPLFRPLHAEPRFQSILKSMKL